MSKKSKEKFPKRIYVTVELDGKETYVNGATTPEWLLNEDGEAEHVGMYELVSKSKMRKTLTVETL